MDELTDEDVMRIVRAYTEYPPASDDSHFMRFASIMISDLIRYFNLQAERGNDEAAGILALIAGTSTRLFQDRFLENPARYDVKFYAHSSVPVLLSKRKHDRELAEKVVELSNVGVLRPTNTQGKQISSHVSQVAQRLYDWVVQSKFGIIAMSARRDPSTISEERRKELEEEGVFFPTMTRENAVKLYWPCCNRVLIRLYGEHFENASDFAHYWTKKGIKELEGSAQRNVVRKRIRKDLKQALVSLAASF